MRRLTFSLLSCLLLVSPSWAAPRSEAGRLADAPFLTTLAAVVRDNLVVAAGQNETGDAGLALYAREGSSQ